MGFKLKIGIPSPSTANRTPIPKGQPFSAIADSVPREPNSMMVLDTSAEDGLVVFASDAFGCASATPIEHFGTLREDLRGAHCLKQVRRKSFRGNVGCTEREGTLEGGGEMRDGLNERACGSIVPGSETDMVPRKRGCLQTEKSVDSRCRGKMVWK